MPFTQLAGASAAAKVGPARPRAARGDQRHGVLHASGSLAAAAPPQCRRELALCPGTGAVSAARGLARAAGSGTDVCGVSTRLCLRSVCSAWW
jgi:hypothetical protein